MTLTLVVYHYVRRSERTPFPGIKALHTDAFDQQLDYICQHYQPISGEELMRAVTAHAPLPERAVLLTFDDGYRDCLTDAAPLLHRHGIRACFFPVSDCVQRTTVLDLNKIQFLLAAVPVPALLNRLRAAVTESHGASWESLHARFAHANRWDSSEVQFIKRLLQFALPPSIRIPLLDQLFRRYITEDETAFSRELYCGKEDLLALRDQGHTIGSHGHRHLRLDHSSPEEQAEEIGQSLVFLRSLGVSGDWMIAYPHGGVEPGLLPQLRGSGCRVGLTIDGRVADLQKDDPLRLPRINANDLPPIGPPFDTPP